MSRTSRKQDHIQEALTTGQSGEHGFHDVHFVHNALPQLDKKDVSIQTSIGELSLSSPLVMNAMTGGGAGQTYKINQRLARIAKECQLAIAVGSQMAALKDAGQAYTYKIVRQENPTGTVFANLGSEATVDQAQRAVDMLQADALQIHLNVVQELVMPEGDREFSAVLANIEQIAHHVSVPVFIKEVGFGMSGTVARQLTETGVKAIDVGGYGGTNFATIENKRRRYTYDAFNSWGIQTVPSLIEVLQSTTGVDIIASGGIRTPLEVMKSITIGARAVGMSGFFLRLVEEYSHEEIVQMIAVYHDELKSMMCALGMTSLDTYEHIPVVVRGQSREWLELRGFDVSALARRDMNRKKSKQ